MTAVEVLEEVRSELGDWCGRPMERITPDMLLEDLGVDVEPSIYDMLEQMCARFKLNVDDVIFTLRDEYVHLQVQTVQELATMMEKHVG